MSREAMQQALKILENGAIARPGWVPDYDDAITALRAALAEQDDDLTAAWMAGAAEGRKRAEQAQPVAWHVFNVTVSGRLHEWEPTTFAFALKDGKHALYTTPPAPQPLTDEEILSVVGWERAEMYMKLAPNFPVDEAKQETLKNARAVEAEVLKRMGVGK